MSVVAAHELVERVGSFDPASDRAALCAVIADASRLEAWAASRRLAATQQLAQISPFVEGDLADAQRVTHRHADKVVRQAEAVAAVPGLADAMGDGAVSVEHVEVFERAKRRLEPELWTTFVEGSERLVRIATHGTAQDLDDAVTQEVRRLERSAGDDGTARFEQQRRATTWKTWVDRATGMVQVRGQFDPLSGTRLANSIDGKVDAMFATGLPDTAPSDPLARQGHLQALALVALVSEPRTGAGAGGGSGGGGAGWRDTVIAVVDGTKVDANGNPEIQLPRGIELPDAVVQQMITAAKVHPVLVAGTRILWAPGKLDLGRTTRVANRAQRRALRAVHRTCMIPGCDVPFEHCDIHHFWWWEHEGRTDLRYLGPLCTRHHHRIHDDGWQVAITVDRQLIVHLPDGTVLGTGPPEQGAA